MAVTPIRDTHAQNLELREETRFGTGIRTLTGNVTIPLNHATHIVLDPGGASRNVTLPAVADSKGLSFLIANAADAAENLVVKNADADTIVTVAEDGVALVVCDGVTWRSLMASSPSSFDGGDVSTVANANVVGGVPVIHRIDITAGALGNTDVVLTNKTRVIDAWLVLRGAGVATTTLQVFNGATAITNAMAASGSDQALVRATSLNDAAWEVAAGGTLRVTSATGATQPDATVYVLGIPVA